MSFFELANDRYSVRKFEQEPVRMEDIVRIIKAIQTAPSAMGVQPTKVIIFQSEEGRKLAAKCTECTFDAPLIMLFCCDMDKVCSPEPGYYTSDMDISIACTQAMYAAWELGIGSCWVRRFKADEVAKILDLPENIKPICFLPMGYIPSDAKPIWSRHFDNVPIKEMIQWK